MPFIGSDNQEHLTFNEATRQAEIALPPIPYAANTTQPIQCTKVGFLARIFVPVSINFTTGGSGTYANYDPIQGNAGVAGNDVPTPWNVVPQVVLQSNQGTRLYATSGYGNYLKSLTARTARDQMNPLASYNTAGPNSVIFNRPSTYTVSTTYTINFMLDIPVSLKEANNAGLVLCQNPTTGLQLNLTWADIAHNLLYMTGGGSITVNNVVCNPTMLYYNLPDDKYSYPDLSYSYITLEDYNINLTPQSDIYNPLVGNTYLEIITQYINNGVALPAAQFGNSSLTYQAINTPYNISGPAQLYLQQERRGGMSMPDGVIWWDFIFGSGIPEAYNPRDVINASQLTDLQIIQNHTATLTGLNYKRSIRSMLAKV